MAIPNLNDPAEKIKWLREMYCDDQPDFTDRMRCLMTAYLLWSDSQMPDEAYRAMRLSKPPSEGS